MKTTAPKDPTPEHDPWLSHLDRWEMRVMKIAILCGLLIFAYKRLRHEWGQAHPSPPVTAPSAPPSTRP